MQAITSNFQKLVLVLIIFAPVTKVGKRDNVILDKIPCIYNLLYFCKNKKNEM